MYYLHGGTREKGNVMVVNKEGYLGPVCDSNWDITEVCIILLLCTVASRNSGFVYQPQNVHYRVRHKLLDGAILTTFSKKLRNS